MTIIYNPLPLKLKALCESKAVETPYSFGYWHSLTWGWLSPDLGFTFDEVYKIIESDHPMPGHYSVSNYLLNLLKDPALLANEDVCRATAMIRWRIKMGKPVFKPTPENPSMVIR